MKRTAPLQASSPVVRAARSRRHPGWLARALSAGGLVPLALVGALALPCPAGPPLAKLGPPLGQPAPPRPPDLTKSAPALPPPCQVYPIDLCTALRLAEGENPTIGIGRQAIQEALANQLRANSLLLPSLRAGTNYHDHQGVLQNSFGEIRHVHSDSLYVGGGARTLAAETVAFPMVQVISPLADALFEPLVARRLVAVRRSQSDATTNQVLLEVARRFLELVSAEAELGAVKQTEEDMNQVVQLTAAFAKAGRGREADASRARGEALLLHTEEQRAEERVAVASANLAEVLNLDTSVRLQTPAQVTGLLQLVDLHGDLEALVQQAQAARPEIAANTAEVARRQAMFRQEKFRPFLPTISIGYSAGSFGGGTNRVDLVPQNSNFGRFGSRADFDVVAYWNVQNLGAGNAARADERRAQREVATSEQVRLLNRVRREVVEAHGRAEAGLRRVELARARLRTAEAGYREDLHRIRGGEGLPIEILNSVNRLGQARRNLIESILEHNDGQFQLFVALGQRPTNACPPTCGANG